MDGRPVRSSSASSRPSPFANKAKVGTSSGRIRDGMVYLRFKMYEEETKFRQRRLDNIRKGLEEVGNEKTSRIPTIQTKLRVWSQECARQIMCGYSFLPKNLDWNG